MTAARPTRLTKDQEEQLRDLPEEPDVDDLPEAPEENWSFAERGKFYRQIQGGMFVRLDADVLSWLQRNDPDVNGYLNRILHEKMESEPRGE